MTKAKSIYSKKNTKLTKKRGCCLTIFAVLTARTLYTYKNEVAINNDNTYRSAVAFYPWNLPSGMSPSTGLAELHLSGSPSGGVHLSGWPADTLPASGVLAPRRRETPNCVCGAPGDVPVRHDWLLSWIRIVFHFFFRASWLVRMIITSLILTFDSRI